METLTNCIDDKLFASKTLFKHERQFNIQMYGITNTFLREMHYYGKQ